MQKVIDNSRQIPKLKEYMASANYYDTLYGYLQAMSHWDGITGHPRYVQKKKINYSRIAGDLNLSRQTVSKRFNAMLEGTKQHENSAIPALIRLNEKENKYELIYLEASIAMLIPQSTLEVLVSALNENAISIYVYLYNRYYASGCREFQFSYPQLKTAIGLRANSNGNNYIITGILFILKRIGLLNYSSKLIVDEDGRSVSEHKILTMTNQIDDLPNNIVEEDGNDIKRWKLYSKMTGKERVQQAC